MYYEEATTDYSSARGTLKIGISTKFQWKESYRKPERESNIKLTENFFF